MDLTRFEISLKYGSLWKYIFSNQLKSVLFVWGFSTKCGRFQSVLRSDEPWSPWFDQTGLCDGDSLEIAHWCGSDGVSIFKLLFRLWNLLSLVSYYGIFTPVNRYWTALNCYALYFKHDQQYVMYWKLVFCLINWSDIDLKMQNMTVKYGHGKYVFCGLQIQMPALFLVMFPYLNGHCGLNIQHEVFKQFFKDLVRFDLMNTTQYPKRLLLS